MKALKTHLLENQLDIIMIMEIAMIILDMKLAAEINLDLEMLPLDQNLCALKLEEIVILH